jgi:hypothetical protein
MSAILLDSVGRVCKLAFRNDHQDENRGFIRVIWLRLVFFHISRSLATSISHGQTQWVCFAHFMRAETWQIRTKIAIVKIERSASAGIIWLRLVFFDVSVQIPSRLTPGHPDLAP